MFNILAAIHRIFFWGINLEKTSAEVEQNEIYMQ